MSKLKKTVLLVGAGGAAYRPSLWASYFFERSEDYALLIDTQNWGSGLPGPFRKLFKFGHLLLAYLISDIIVIQAMTHCNPSARVLYWLNRIFRKTIFVDIYISSFETQVIDRQRYMIDSKESFELKRVDQIAFLAGNPLVFLTQSERNYYCSILGINVQELNSEIIPLVTPERPLGARPFLSKKRARPTIAWWGREGNPLHGVEAIVAACRLLIEEGYPADFAFFASGNQDWENFLEACSDLREHENVLISKEFSFANGRLTEFLLEKTDLALGTFGVTRKAKTVLVNKVLDAASFGIPCLTQESDGLLEFFIPGETIFVSEIDAPAIASAIKICLENQEEADRLGRSARKLIRSNFSPEAFHRSIDEILSTR